MGVGGYKANNSSTGEKLLEEQFRFSYRTQARYLARGSLQILFISLLLEEALLHVLLSTIYRAFINDQRLLLFIVPIEERLSLITVDINSSLEIFFNFYFPRRLSIYLYYYILKNKKKKTNYLSSLLKHFLEISFGINIEERNQNGIKKELESRWAKIR